MAVEPHAWRRPVGTVVDDQADVPEPLVEYGGPSSSTSRRRRTAAAQAALLKEPTRSRSGARPICSCRVDGLGPRTVKQANPSAYVVIVTGDASSTGDPGLSAWAPTTT